MDVIEGGLTSLRKVSRHWNIPLTSLSNHLYGKTTFKKPRLEGVLIEKEDQGVVVWVLAMLELLISLQQLKLKVEKLIQTRPTPFQGGMLGNSWW
jgi:hypothetical protein